MIVYFADRNMSVLGVASTDLPGGLIITDDLKTEEVETGVATFSCKLPYTPETRQKVECCGAVGNYLFRNAGMGNELYTIVETEADTEAGTVYLYAEDAGLSLLNAMALAYSAEAEQPISFYFEKWLEGTGFVVGLNEAAGDRKQLAWDGEATVTERLQDVAEQFECELSFSFDIQGLSVTGKYANIHRKRGKDVGAQLRLNEDVSRIVAKQTITNLATSLLVVGGTPNGTDIPVTLEGYSYDDGDCYVSGRYLHSRSALSRWGERGADGQTRQIVRLFSSDALSQEKLCSLAVEELNKSREAEVNYEVELAKLPDGVRIGDRVNIVDDAGGLYLSARILKLETSVAEGTRTATLGEYLIQDSGIAEKVETLAKQFSAAQSNADSAAAAAATAQAAVDKAQERVTTAETQITQNADSITAVASRTTENESNIRTLEQTADSLTTRISEVSTAVDNEVANRTTIIREYNGGVLVAKTGQTIGALVNADGSFDVVGVSWNGDTPAVTSTLYARYGTETTIKNEKGDYIELSDGNIKVSGTLVSSDITSDSCRIYAMESEPPHDHGALIQIIEPSDVTQLNIPDQDSYTISLDSYYGEQSSEITLRYDKAVIAAPSLQIIADDSNIDLGTASVALQSSQVYTVFDSLVESGTVVVVKKLGWCQVKGSVKLGADAADWTTILDSASVPAPQDKRNIFITVPYWGTSYSRPARIRIGSSGGLAVRYGSANEFSFNITYPI